MLKRLTPLFILALVAMNSQALAQETKNEEAESAETSSAEQLDLGQPVQDGPKIGDRYSKEKFGDWDLACIKTGAETDPCSLLQILTDGTGNPVAEVSMFRIENGGQAVAAATVMVPLETLLPAQLTIAVDDTPGKRYAYSFCGPLGCVAQIGLTSDDIAAFKKGSKATVSIVPAPAPDQTVALTLSLAGFTAGFEAVDVVSK